MLQNPKVLRPANRTRVLCVAIYVAGLALYRMYLPFGISDRHRVWIFPLYGLFGALWLAEVFTTRIVLAADCLRVVSNFRSRTISRRDIANVTWEKGCGASLQLQAGKSIRLPSVGRTAIGLANAIRAWLGGR